MFASLESSSTNIGDDIQVLAALQFLSDEVRFIDRDRIGYTKILVPTKLILNGWFMHSPAAWPPPELLRPLVISFHAGRAKFHNSWRLDYLREQSLLRPIGARDLATLLLFEQAGIANAYLSGCLTLTLQSRTSTVRQEHVVAVDLDPACLAALQKFTSRPVLAATQALAASRRSWRWRLFEKRKWNRGVRFALAKRRLNELAGAFAVATSRLHVALPCLALGTPVLMVTDRPADPRLDTWLPHLHWCTLDDFRKGRFEFDFRDPPANRDGWRQMAASLRASCEEFTGVPFRSFDDVG